MTSASNIAPNSPASTGTGRARLVQLDILRGLAILLVLGRHAVVKPEDAGVWQPVARVLWTFGWTGVDLFFVLSGFLVGGLLFKELRERGSLDIKRFWIRRGFKIWPSYFIYLCCVTPVVIAYAPFNRWDFKIKHGLRQIFPNWVHLQNYFGTPRGQTWSLAVEEHFYLLLPILILGLLHFGRGKRDLSKTLRPIIGIAGALLIGCLLLRLLNWNKPFDQRTHSEPTHLRADTLFLGVLLAYVYHFAPARFEAMRRYRPFLWPLGLACLCPLLFLELKTSAFVTSFGFTLAAIGYACILVALLTTPADDSWGGKLVQSKVARAVSFVGVWSYPIYLWHIDLAYYPVVWLDHQAFAAAIPGVVAWPLWIALYVSLAIGAGVLLGSLIDRPALALRERLFPARSDALREETWRADSLPTTAVETSALSARP